MGFSIILGGLKIMELKTIDEYSEQEQLEMEIENKLAYVLAKIYVKIPWRKIGVPSAHKFFVDRIRASGNAKNIKEFIDTLTRKVNVEFVKIDTKVLQFLDDHRAVSLMLIRKESTFIANLALEAVDAVKRENEGQTTLGV